LDSNTVEVKVVSDYLEVVKTVNEPRAEPGDVLIYIVRVRNVSEADELYRVVAVDQFPRGFQYVPGTAELDGERTTEPTTLSESVYQFALGDIPAGEEVTLRYYALITDRAKVDDNANSVTVTGETSDGETLTAGPARAYTKVLRGVFSEMGLIIGKVFEDRNGDRRQNPGEPGLGKVDVILEDGTIVTTDASGRFTLPFVEPGDHLVSIDRRTLPEGYGVRGRESKLVRLPGALTVKVNFPLSPPEVAAPVETPEGGESGEQPEVEAAPEGAAEGPEELPPDGR